MSIERPECEAHVRTATTPPGGSVVTGPRTCQAKGCGTRLNSYNAGPHCGACEQAALDKRAAYLAAGGARRLTLKDRVRVAMAGREATTAEIARTAELTQRQVIDVIRALHLDGEVETARRDARGRRYQLTIDAPGDVERGAA